jgi:hypothetical protein
MKPLPDIPEPLNRRPRFGRFNLAERYSGVSRRRLYEWQRQRPELFRKNGFATIVDFDVLDQILLALPIAESKSARPTNADDATTK